MSRINKTDWYFELCDTISKRSTCIRKHVGAIIVKEGRILSTGYNGAPSGEIHCIDTLNCVRPKEAYDGISYTECRANHAEWNCIIQAAKYGISIEGADIYVTLKPCTICLKVLKSVGIRVCHYRNATGYLVASNCKDM